MAGRCGRRSCVGANPAIKRTGTQDTPQARTLRVIYRLTINCTKRMRSKTNGAVEKLQQLQAEYEREQFFANKRKTLREVQTSVKILGPNQAPILTADLLSHTEMPAVVALEHSIDAYNSELQVPGSGRQRELNLHSSSCRNH